MKIFFLSLWFLSTIPLYCMEGVQEHIYTKILNLKKQNNVDDSSIPQGFLTQEWGEIIRFEQQCAVTHIGNIYFFDTSNSTWECIHDSGETPDGFKHFFNTTITDWKKAIASAIDRNDFAVFSYHPTSKTLMYPSSNGSINRLGNKGYFSPFNEKDYPFLLIEQTTKTHTIQPYACYLNTCNIVSLCQSNDGLYAACTIKRTSSTIEGWIYASRRNYQDPIYTIKILKRNTIEDIDYQDNPYNPLSENFNKKTNELKICECKREYFPVMHTFFTPYNDICVETVVPLPGKSYTYHLTKDSLIKQSRVIDIENNSYVPLSIAYQLPSLHSRLVRNPYRLLIKDKRFLTALPFLSSSTEHLDTTKDTIIKEIGKYIAFVWYTHDSRLQKHTDLVYGSDEKVVPTEEKKILETLNARPFYSSDLLKTFSFNTDQEKLFLVANYIKKYGSSYRFFNQFFEHLFKNAYDPIKLKEIITPAGTIVIEDSGKLTLMYESLNNNDELYTRYLPITRSFVEEYMEHYKGEWTAASVHQWVKDKTFNRCELSSDQEYLTICYQDCSATIFHATPPLNENGQRLDGRWEKIQTHCNGTQF